MPAQDVNDAWRGWSANHDHIGEIFAEFIDNALSMRLPNPALEDEILIKWTYTPLDDFAMVTISDKLGGMIDPTAAWTVGNRQNQTGPLNEHGYGFKHSIASANPGNDNWKFWTRTAANIANDEFCYYEAPYDWGTDPVLVSRGALGTTDDWPGGPEAGTIFQFRCNLAKFKGLRTALGIGGNAPAGPSGYSANLEAYLGFVYGSAIDNNDINIKIKPDSPAPDENGTLRPWYRVRAGLYPANYSIYQQPAGGIGGAFTQIKGTATHAFDGIHPITYTYEAIQVNSSPPTDWRKPFYQRNSKNRGLEIRLNGRVLAYGLFDRSIWNRESHPLFNAFVFRIDLQANQLNKQYIPSTKTTKSGMQITDELLELFRAARNHCPNMDLFKTATENTNESVMKEKLVRVLERGATPGNNIVVQRETPSWDACSLDIHSTHQGLNRTFAYECKKGRAKALDLYQLVMYCDWLHEQGHTADGGILVANQYSPDIPAIIASMMARGYHTPLSMDSWEVLTADGTPPYGNTSPGIPPVL